MRYIGKYIALSLVTAATVLSGCSSESYPGIQYEPVIASSLVNNESGRSTGLGLPVKLAVFGSSFVITNITRGTGPIDDVSDEDRFKKAIFYVYAFRDNPDEKGELAYNPSYTQRSANDNPDCLVDNNNDALLGRPARVNIQSGVVKLLREDKKDTTIYFGSRHQDNGYDFFLYHIDDFVPTSANGHRDESGIYYDMELDGTQDLMTGRSFRFTEELLTKNYANYSELPVETRTHLLNIGTYSAYSANYEINPIIQMNHVLTKLEFYAYPADKSAKDIEFIDIEITARCNGRFYVVRKSLNGLQFEVDENAEPKAIPLQERGDDGTYQALTPSKYKIDWEDGMDTNQWINNKEARIHIGGDMMLPSAETFFMKVIYKQKVHTSPDVFREVEANYVLKAPELEETIDEATGAFSFLPSKSYAINLGVYGGRTPDVIVGLNGWEDGGSIDVAGDPTEDVHE